MSGMFEVIASSMDAEHEALEGSRARIAATKRVEDRFLAYLSKAESNEELAHRVARIESEAFALVEAACEEHRYAKPSEMFNEVMDALQKQAVGVMAPDGDTLTQERVDLPSADVSGLGDAGSPTIDKKDVPKGGLDAVDVPSVRHPHELQSVRDVPEWGNRHDGPEVADPTESPRETVDADAAMQPEHHVAPNTDTWSDAGTQAEPVTSRSEAKWVVLD